jgi:FG-GAP-like repeat
MKKNICFDVVLARSLEAILHSRWLIPKSKFPAGAGSYPEGTFGELGKPRRIGGAPASKTNSYHLTWRRLKRHIGATLGALLIPLVFSGWAFATHESFGHRDDPTPKEDWTREPYYGTRGTFFADVTGDRKADAIVVNDNTVTVRRSDGQRFGPKEDWTGGPFYGNRPSFFADVTGDGKADAIVINDNTITVRRSDGQRFGPKEDWTGGSNNRFLGWIAVADVDGDGRADFIRVYDKIRVRRSDGSSFGREEDWTDGLYGGEVGLFFADVTGDGKADAIAVDYDKITVREAYCIRFCGFNSPPIVWTRGYYGTRMTFFADVTGLTTPDSGGKEQSCGQHGDYCKSKADAIAVGYDFIRVRVSTGSKFDERLPNVGGPGWTQEPYYGPSGKPGSWGVGTFFADVTGDGSADAIVVGYDKITVRRSCFRDGDSCSQ